MLPTSHKVELSCQQDTTFEIEQIWGVVHATSTNTIAFMWATNDLKLPTCDDATITNKTFGTPNHLANELLAAL